MVSDVCSGPLVLSGSCVGDEIWRRGLSYKPPRGRRIYYGTYDPGLIGLNVMEGRTQADSFWNSDYINPIDLCNRLNAYIVPEAAVHGFLTFLFIINGYWVAIVLNLPLLAFNAKKWVVFLLLDPGVACLSWVDGELTNTGSTKTSTCWMRLRSSAS